MQHKPKRTDESPSDDFYDAITHQGRNVTHDEWRKSFRKFRKMKTREKNKAHEHEFYKDHDKPKDHAVWEDNMDERYVEFRGLRQGREFDYKGKHWAKVGPQAYRDTTVPDLSNHRFRRKHQRVNIKD